MSRHLVMGLGVTGQAVLRALRSRGEEVVVVDDSPTPSARAVAESMGVDLVESPDDRALAGLLAEVDLAVPSPGVPDHHPLFGAALAAGVPVISEFDLAATWDDRPLLAVTGTNGKTTVTELVRSMLERSGRRALAVGNTELPLVTAIDDPTAEIFVVEASSFRLLHTRHFAPGVATWLNLAADHLDSHRDIEAYTAAKARVWRDQDADQVAIGNADDPVVAANLARAPARGLTFGVSEPADYQIVGDRLVTDRGHTIARTGELRRSFPHDLANALAAAATALNGGATIQGARDALLSFRGLPHRLALVGKAGGVHWYDDSKATAPQATRAALRGLESVVLIAGGRNKGLDLGELACEVSHVRAVVAIGEAAAEVAAAFDGLREVRTAASMDDAVVAAVSLARPGDAVLLSPACASFDWYGSYAERGDDFARAVHELTAGADR